MPVLRISVHVPLDCCENACVEYNCSYSIRGEDIVQGWNKTSFLELKKNELRLKRNHNYYAKIQGQTAITGNKQTYFVAWTGMGTPFIESIVYESEFSKKVQSSVMMFSKCMSEAHYLDLRNFTLAQYVQTQVYMMLNAKQTEVLSTKDDWCLSNRNWRFWEFFYLQPLWNNGSQWWMAVRVGLVCCKLV